jgi:surface antigen
MFRQTIRFILSFGFKTPLFFAIVGLVLPVLPAGNAYADPPPWAPAHGYRNKHKGHHDEDEDRNERQETYVVPYDIDRGTCNRELVGEVLGGATGAAVGSTVGKGSGKTAAVVGGAVIGVIVGGYIGRQMDKVDQNCAGQILEHAEDHKQIVWSDSHTGARYLVTPTETFRGPDGRYCRKYTTDAYIGDQRHRAYGAACRQPDGAWAAMR